MRKNPALASLSLFALLSLFGGTNSTLASVPLASSPTSLVEIMEAMQVHFLRLTQNYQTLAKYDELLERTLELQQLTLDAKNLVSPKWSLEDQAKYKRWLGIDMMKILIELELALIDKNQTEVLAQLKALKSIRELSHETFGIDD